jgi:hypothetical protein
LNFIKNDKQFLLTTVLVYVLKHIIEALNAEFINYLNYGGYPEAVLSITAQKDSARYIR